MEILQTGGHSTLGGLDCAKIKECENVQYKVMRGAKWG